MPSYGTRFQGIIYNFLDALVGIHEWQRCVHSMVHIGPIAGCILDLRPNDQGNKLLLRRRGNHPPALTNSRAWTFKPILIHLGHDLGKCGGVGGIKGLPICKCNKLAPHEAMQQQP